MSFYRSSFQGERIARFRKNCIHCSRDFRDFVLPCGVSMGLCAGIAFPLKKHNDAEKQKSGLFSIAEARKKMLEDKFAQMHETLWTQISYMSLEEQDKFFSDLKQLERIERALQAPSMLDTDEADNHVPCGLGVPSSSRYRGSIMIPQSLPERKGTGVRVEVGAVSVPDDTSTFPRFEI
jgi:hypothetical protein